jgi:nucleoside-diphosphate-sugar epimerase
VDDLIDGLSKLFWADSIHSPINLGNPTPISMLDLASEIISLTDSSSEIIFKELPQDDPQDRRPDITKAMKHLNWELKFDKERSFAPKTFASRIAHLLPASL